MRRWFPVLLSVTVIAVSVLVAAAPGSGPFIAVVLALGTSAYACLAMAIGISTRLPLVETVLGPLDRAYGVHKVLGITALVLVLAHLTLATTASASSVGIIEPQLLVIGLGALGLLVLAGTAAVALSDVSHSRFQKVHGPLAGAAFLILTLHAVVAAATGHGHGAVTTAWTAVLAVIGLGGIAQRIHHRYLGGRRMRVTATTPRERALEVDLVPSDDGGRVPPVRPGQFIVLTASPGGVREGHPFTVTRSDEHGLSVMVRAVGDWTALLQDGLDVGDEVLIDGPFGGFLPATSGTPEVWVAGGSGVTPFLATIRPVLTEDRATRAAGGEPPERWPVRLVVAAHSQEDAPAWEELRAAGEELDWLTVVPAFTESGDRLEDETLDALVADAPAEASWYVCGPQDLTKAVRAALRRAERSAERLHAERFAWR
ncbi:ferredoxin reductase family protein [Actinomyces radicidentis]|uniref:ferredoxin reductase family protein n=1 Tax=Actinomyces radicidentis TaxID=111015 RepID=UPI0028EA2463|nr:ferredoxin reductase family protein [Actinomyces radicidentis]